MATIRESHAAKMETIRSRLEGLEEAMRERWRIFDAYARQIIAERGTMLNEQDLRLEVEGAMIREGYPPPAMTGWVVCQGCGPAMNYWGSGEEVVACPWCETEYGLKRVRAKLEKELHEWNEKGPMEIRKYLRANPRVADEWICESMFSDTVTAEHRWALSSRNCRDEG